jgi:Concanavalin A-like lectin/glucanases superfamily
MGFIENFNDDAFNAGLWQRASLLGSTDAAVTVLEQSERLEVTPLTGASGEHYNGAQTIAAYDLTGAQVAVHVAQVVAGGLCDTQFAITLDGSNYYALIHEGGTLYFQKRIGGTRDNTSVTYNASTHAWWRIRHDAGGDTIEWETSSDGASWTNRRSAAREIAVTGMQAEISAGTWQSEGTGGVAYFDDFRLLQTEFADTLLADGAGLIYLLDESSGTFLNVGPSTGYDFDEVSSAWTRAVTGLSGPDALGVQSSAGDGSSPTYGHAQVTTPPADFDGATAFSLEIVLTATARGSGVVWIIGAFTETTVSLEFNSGASKLQAGVTITGSTFTLYDVTSDVAGLASDWHHIVMTWDGTDFRVYYQGTLVVNETLGGGSDTLDMSYPNARMALMGAPDYGSANVAGIVDVIGLYEDVVLSPEQVAAHLEALSLTADTPTALFFRRRLNRSVGARTVHFFH